MISLRASGLPLAFACPASVRAPSVVIYESSEPAGEGSATHEALRPLVELGTLDWGHVEAMADRYGVKADAVRPLVAMAAKAWKTLAPLFPNPRTETEWRYEGDGFVLTGHTDVDSHSGTVIHLLDWKTGRKDYDYGHQMRAYNALALASTDAQEATSFVSWVREQEIEKYTSRWIDARDWLADLKRHVVDWNGTYYPGEHCAFCPRSKANDCAAITALVQRAAAPFVHEEPPPKDLSEWTDEKILNAFSTTSVVLRYAKMLDKAIRDHVKRHGPVRHNGRELAVVEESRTSIDAIEAWETFMGLGLDNEDLRRILRVSSKDLSDVVRAKSPRGKKAQAVQTMKDELERVGAVTASTIEKVVSRRSAE